MRNKMAFAWGLNEDGQLGIGDLQTDLTCLKEPTEVPTFSGKQVGGIGCGRHHTCILLQDGTVYTCGANDRGQLGRGGVQSTPAQVSAIETFVVTQVACGDDHTLALSDKGQVLAWGRDDRGQCGVATGDREDKKKPKILKSLGSHQVISVACGSSHSIVLEKGGRLFSWGDNMYGQLGLRSPGQLKYSERPLELTSLHGVPVTRVACGGWHSFALTVSGALFAWGRNNFGQLGIDGREDRHTPKVLQVLQSQMVKYIACGSYHSALLTASGGLFLFGQGSKGQLGHGSLSEEVIPRQVIELMGNEIIQVACGRQHTLALEGKTGRLYSFGEGRSGQLGMDIDLCSSPRLVPGPWTVHNINSMEGSSSQRMVITAIHAGGDQCQCTVSKDDEVTRPLDFRVLFLSRLPSVLSESLIREVPRGAPIASLLPKTKLSLETVFSSPACLNASFLKSVDGQQCCPGSRTGHGVDLDAARSAFELLVENMQVLEMISGILTRKLVPSLHDHSNSSPSEECLRLYLLLMECPILSYPKHMWCRRTILSLGTALLGLKEAAKDTISRWWSGLLPRHLNRILTVHKACVLTVLQEGKRGGILTNEDKDVLDVCLNVLGRLHTVNQNHGEILPYYMFNIPDIGNYMDIQKVYLQFFQHKLFGHHVAASGKFDSFCDYPFLFDAEMKTQLLQLDAMLQMRLAMEDAQRMSMESLFLSVALGSMPNPYLVLCVVRDNVVSSAIDQLSHLPQQELKKPLKVIFVGEEAVDAGGVKKEFFMLIMREVLNPKYGMFRHYTDSGKIWFNNKTLEELQMFRLIGLVCGLAIYNQIIVSLPFPLALYKKILNRPTTLDDFKQLEPQVADNFQSMLDFDDHDSFQDVFPLVFQIEEDNLGHVETTDLIPEGSDKEVTFNTRQDYVDAYVDYQLNSSVKNQFAQFCTGFLEVCGGHAISFFHPQELMAMVVGNEDFDWEDLEKNVQYKGEYSSAHPTIRLFWQVFRELSVEDKKKFLVFLTGSDHVPIQGWKSLQVIIQPVKGGENFFPVAHTCFNLLDLPMYTSKDVLREKLLLAIEHKEGFTLV